MRLRKKLLSLALTLSLLFALIPNSIASNIDVSDCTYVVDNMVFHKNNSTTSILSEATKVSVDVTRRIEGGASDNLIIATYSKDGDFLEKYTVKHHIDFKETSTVTVSVNVPKDKVLGEVKAFVWSSLTDMTPLSNALSSKNNMKIDPNFEYPEKVQTEFSDVSLDDPFADAVFLMASLDVMNGYEDGKFHPTEEIRVADAARFITRITKGELVASLLEDEALVSDEIASPVERGFINYCVKKGFMTPDENGYVNYSQPISVADFFVLSLNALGYKDYATLLGGWPTGYIEIAEKLGLAIINDLNFKENTTRSTAAEILYSVIDMPIVENVGFSYTDSGELVARQQIQDGVESQYYKSLLTEKFKIYSVDGYVTATYKYGVGLDKNEVQFGIAKSRRYEPEELQFNTIVTDFNYIQTSAERIINVDIEDTDADNYIGLYSIYLSYRRSQ